MNRLPGLDGLRALACLMVFGVHVGQHVQVRPTPGHIDLQQLLANGNTGVALFFSLSGFLLSLPYWQARVDGRPVAGIRTYLLRRVARIVPAFLTCMLGLVLLRGLWRSDNAWLVLAQHALFVFNLDARSIFAINPAFWTVAVEMQFYVLLPCVMLLLGRASPRRAGVAFVAMSGLSWIAYDALVTAFAGNPAQVPPSPVWIYSLAAHLPHFLLGCAASAWFSLRPASPQGRLLNDMILAVAWLAVIVVLATPLDGLLRVSNGRYNYPYVPGLLCLIVALTPRARYFRRMLESAPLRGLGVVSYGVYIYHLPIQNAVARLLTRDGSSLQEQSIAFVATSLGLTIAVATMSYWCVERWFLHRPAAR